MSRRNKNGYRVQWSAGAEVYEHIVVASRALGRALPCGAEVHHVNGDKTDNQTSNLVICQDKAFHKLLHVRSIVRAAGGDPNTDKLCRDCDRVKPVEDFNVMRANKGNGRQSVCRECSKVRNAAKRKAAA